MIIFRQHTVSLSSAGKYLQSLILLAGLALAIVISGCSTASSGTGSCGDGTVQTGEECDDGNISGGDGCSSDCQFTAVCGDALCNLGETESSCPDDCTTTCPKLNPCGGCAMLPAEGSACGECGVNVCDGQEAVLCDDPGLNACGGCMAIAEVPGDTCNTCGTIACDGLDATSCDASSCCMYADQVLPSSWADTGGCAATDNHFNFPSCGGWKVYDVNPGQWLGLRTWGDGCPGCVLWHVAFDIQEDLGNGWVTVEHHDPGPDVKSMAYFTSYQATTSQIRISSADGFYAQVYGTGVTNGGFETGTASPMVGQPGNQAGAITGNPTYVANRGAYSFGAVYTGATYGTNNGMYWGLTTGLLDCSFLLADTSKLHFDTYGADYQAYAHHHVTVTFSDATTAFYDSYIDFSNGILAGWSLQTVDVGTGNAGKTIDSVAISFHKDHSTYSRYAPTIFIDNITLE